MDPLGTALKAIVPGAGILELVGGYLNPNREVYTGYNPEITTQKDMNNGSDYNPLIKIATDRLKPVVRRTAASLYNQNPNQYKPMLLNHPRNRSLKQMKY